MKKLVTILLFFAVWQVQANYFNEKVINEVSAPEAVLGFKVGDWHVRHDQIQRYFEVVAAQSDRAQLEVIGKTHEQRPLLQLVVSSPENLANLEQIRLQHLAQVQGTASITADSKVIIWLGYSIHGNEPSGANSALVLAHYLTASTNPEVQQWLKQAVILIQPSLNPDGNDRFATWVNMHRGKTAVTDPQHREHVEPWPNGRPNHYWFDLNRDWLLLQHPESQARLVQFHKWQPNIVGDYHEMGTNSTFFFQPGIPSRNYPLTPERNFELTKMMAGFHAQAFNQRGALYFTQESFDDFYIGKGSTYPDINGSVGILFEQASSRGHAQESINGILAFADTIKNQFDASLSTIRGAVTNRQQLLSYQQEFFESAAQQARGERAKGYILTESQDQSRLTDLLRLLAQHQITVYRLEQDWQYEQQQFKAGQSYYVPLQQAQYRLLKAAFSTDKLFKDNTFYDVSAWTLPYAYNIDFVQVNREPGRALADQPWQWQPRSLQQTPEADGYAYVLNWQDQQAPVMLHAMLAEGLVVRAALGDFTGTTTKGNRGFKAGAMVIPAGLQPHADWFFRLQKIQERFNLPIHTLTTGLNSRGSDLGSSNFTPVTLPQVLVVAGPGVNSTEAGEVWFNLERLAGVSPSMIEPDRLSRVNLSRYTHIIVPDGNYRSWSDADINRLRQWTMQGGILWGHKGGAVMLAQAKLLQASVWSADDMAELIPANELTYADKEALAGKRRIAGAIFNAELDLSHPLTFGLNRKDMPLFKNSSVLLQPSKSPFVNVAKYSAEPHLAGYTAAEYVPRIAEGAAIVAHNLGRGRVIGMTDNPVFRGYFQGSSRLLVNALYLGHGFSANAEDEGDDE